MRADKSKNMYKIKSSKYQEILRNKITDHYTIDYKDTICRINIDICKFSSKLHRLGKFKMKDAYIIFKDHKPNFKNKLQSRLINPSKTELGKISKNIIQNIIINGRKTSNSNLWKNSNVTNECFKKIKNKSKAPFTQFNIIDSYPSITKNILIDSISYARKYVEITEQYEMILVCRKTVFKNNGSS